MSGSRPAVAYLMDHRVQGRTILPGAAMFEMAVAAGKVLPVTIRALCSKTCCERIGCLH